jgi:two-component system NtrC family sensor kinase
MNVKPTYESLEKRVQDLEQIEFKLKKEIAHLRESEYRHRMKLNNILSPQEDVAGLNLSDMVDMSSIQSIMDDFFKISHIGVGITDMNGTVLAASGLQDICACSYCIPAEIPPNCPESDIQLSNGVDPSLCSYNYCKKNTWNETVPISVGGKHLGNLFLNQFISDEFSAMDMLHSQDHPDEFHEEKKLSPVKEKTSLCDSETVRTAMIFFSNIIHLISEVSFGNLTLTQALMERDTYYNSLLGSERNLSITLKSIGDAVMTTDEAGNITRMNPVAERLTGWHERDVLGKPMETVFTIIREATRMPAESPVNKSLEEAVIVELACDTLLISRDGKEIPIADSCAPIIDDYGDVTGAVLVFRDQTDERSAKKSLEESQERFRALHNASFGGIFIHDQGMIIDCNQGLSDMTGFNREELIGMSGLGLIVPEYRETVLQKILSGFDQSYEAEGIRKDRTIYPLDIRGKKIPYQGRSVQVTEFRDITRRKKAEEALYQANEMLEQRIQERTRELEKLHAQMIIQEKMASVGQLAAGIAHELNNPLNFVSMNFVTLSEYFEDIVDMLKMYRRLAAVIDNKNPSLPESIMVRDREAVLKLDFILEDIPILFKESGSGFERIGRIIQSMRDFSNTDRTGELMAFNIDACIEDTLVIVRNEYKYIADVTTDLGGLPEVRCLPELLNQVFLNLIVNSAQAIKTMNRSEMGRIAIRTWQDETNVYCEIADDGPGIPADIRTRIFEPFFTTKPPGQGTGLGLSICYDIIVEKHQGDLAVQCPESGGAVFSIRVPKNL